jgi:hypothetical protein
MTPHGVKLYASVPAGPVSSLTSEVNVTIDQGSGTTGGLQAIRHEMRLAQSRQAAST